MVLKYYVHNLCLQEEEAHCSAHSVQTGSTVLSRIPFSLLRLVRKWLMSH